jgi:hypothetical protein
VRLTCNLQWPEDPFQIRERLFHPERGQRLTAFDVEWTKNFRAEGAARAFCYSLACIEFRPERSADERVWRIGLKSLYVDDPQEEEELLTRLASDMKDAVAAGCTLAGHQLSSDLSIISSRSTRALDGPGALTELWRLRRDSHPPRVVDTRYDTDHLLHGTSRRLVDVCVELGLDVTQAEISGSMTAMHKKFLATHDESIRERLVAMNLRHSLSTAVVALTALKYRPVRPLNINRLLYDAMWDQLDYFESSAFRGLAELKK